jgi:hypothetical protein
MKQTYTLGEVRLALDGIGDQVAAMEIVNRIGNVTAISKLDSSKFKAVIDAANKKARRSDAPAGSHPATKASREVNEKAAQFWQDKKEAQRAGEKPPAVPSDPGGHNERELQKLTRERADFESFVGGTDDA